MPVDPGMARRRSSSRNPKEAPAEVEARQIWAAVASAGQVRNWLDSTEARRLKGSIDHLCRVMSREEGGECRTARHGLQCCTARHGLRYRTARHGLLKMVPYMNVAFVRAWLSRNLRGNAPPRRTADILRAVGEPNLLPDVVVYAGGALFLAAAGGVVFSSCSRGWAAGVAVPAVVIVEIAAGTAVAMRTTFATSPRVAGAAAHGASAADVLADGGHDHRRGARLSACPAELVHGLHLQSQFGRRPHGQQLTRGTGRSYSNPIGASPLGPAHVPVLINRNHLSSRTWTSRSENVGLSFSGLYA